MNEQHPSQLLALHQEKGAPKLHCKVCGTRTALRALSSVELQNSRAISHSSSRRGRPFLPEVVHERTKFHACNLKKPADANRKNTSVNSTKDNQSGLHPRAALTRQFSPDPRTSVRREFEKRVKPRSKIKSRGHCHDQH